MKKCLLCGTETTDWEQHTCLACGEATWQRFALIMDENGQMVRAADRLDLVDALIKAEAEEPVMVPILAENGDVVEVPLGNAKKRGPGRPRKQQAS